VDKDYLAIVHILHQSGHPIHVMRDSDSTAKPLLGIPNLLKKVQKTQILKICIFWSV